MDISISSGLLLLSVSDFGDPHLVIMAIAVEKPVSGVLRLGSSVSYGEAEATEDAVEPEDETYAGRKTRKSNPRMPVTEDV